MYQTTYANLRFAVIWWREYVTASGKRFPTDGVHTLSYDLIVWC